MVAEALRNWIKFIEDSEPIYGTKFGEPYTFKGYEFVDEETGKTTTLTPFLEYIQWNDVPVNLKTGISWSRVYNEGSLLVFLDSDEDLQKQSEKDETTIEWKANHDKQGYTRFTVFQPIAVGTGTGFSVEEANDDGTVKIWKVALHTKHMKTAKTFLIDADRCLHLLWKKRENGWGACSRVLPLIPFAKMEEQTFQKLTKRAHDIAGGILHFDGIASEAEQIALDTDMGGDLTSVDRIFTKGGRTVEYKTPDLKAAGEFSTIFEMYSKKLCRFMRISQLVLDGEHTGASLGGNDNAETMNSYTEIYEIQEHYRNYLEKVFYKLGKKNTSFIYREILPEEMRVDEQMQQEQFDHENEQFGETAQSADGVDKRNSGSGGNATSSKNNEQTR
ncbi:MAG: hypothetical protein MUO31_00935 [Thermodesulfovibrionales bacterium]|nr:hypothetical protein [Thermodesulfovibrionales bacterium]